MDIGAHQAITFIYCTSSASIWPNDEQLFGMCLVHPAQDSKDSKSRSDP